MLGVGPERRVLVYRGQVVRCHRLVVPALLTSRAEIAQGVEWLRERLAPFMTPIGQADGMIYVSRRDARWRHVANEDELYARLQPLGFRMIVPGRLSVAEQIGHFSGAKIVVCVHGAALTNMIFTPADASIIEINSSALARMDDFHRVAQARGQRMVSVISKGFTAPQETVNVNADYYADIDAVVREVERSL
jgi:capsular polysaccharide biosynthesis protein